MDLSGDKGSRSMDPSARASAETNGKVGGPKCCTDCRTTKTPLWRGGPRGPKSLCNACGIRYTKARREAMGVKEEEEQKKKRRRRREEEKLEEKMGVALKLQLLGFGGDDAILKQRRSWLQRSRRKLGEEEEEAAVLLMALSSGFL